MATYTGYTTLNVNGVLSVGLPLTGSNSVVTDPGPGPDNTNILGDVAFDTFTGPPPILGLGGTTYTFGGVVYDADQNPVGFVGSQTILGSVVNTTFVPDGVDPSGLTVTVLAPGVSAGSQWNLTTAAPVCFMAGVMIMTAEGEVAVETLKAGDLVLTSDGREAPVKWIGTCSVARQFANPIRTLPVRVRAGALGAGLPARDLLVSPDHALFLDGHLVHAGALVNGVTICRETETPDVFTYYHVELEDHALILAEGVPAETFVDNVTRMRFDNWAEHQALFGEGAPISEMTFPRAKSHRQVPEATQRRLSDRMSEMLAEQARSNAA